MFDISMIHQKNPKVHMLNDDLKNMNDFFLIILFICMKSLRILVKNIQCDMVLRHLHLREPSPSKNLCTSLIIINRVAD